MARQLPVISEQFTCTYSKELKKLQREEAAAICVIKDDTDLVELIRKYKGRTLYDKDDDKTWWVWDIQYDERILSGERKKYYEATVVGLLMGVHGWAIPESSYVEFEGTKEIKDSEKDAFFLLDVTDPSNPTAISDVDEMAQAHEEREATRKRGSRVDSGAAEGSSKRQKKSRK